MLDRIRRRLRIRRVRRIYGDLSHPGHELMASIVATSLIYLVRYQPIDSRSMTLADAVDAILNSYRDEENQAIIESVMPTARMEAFLSIYATDRFARGTEG